MRWSGVRISGGSPKIAMTELGRSLLFFCVRRDTEIRTGFARRSRLRAPPSKVFSPRLRTAPIRSSALLAYLRWVCLRAPPSKVLSPRLRTAPIRSSALLAYLRRICLCARRHWLAGNKRGRCRSCGSSPWNAPPRERVPDGFGTPYYTRQSSALSSRLSKRQYPFAAPAAVLTGGRGEW